MNGLSIRRRLPFAVLFRFLLCGYVAVCSASGERVEESEKLDFKICGGDSSSGELGVGAVYFEMNRGWTPSTENKSSAEYIGPGDDVTIHIFADLKRGVESINITDYQIFLDVEQDGLGLKKSIDPVPLCPLAVQEAGLTNCVFNDTIHIIYEFIEDLESGVYEYSLHINKIDIKNGHNDCTSGSGQSARQGNGEGDVLCVKMKKTLVDNYWWDMSRAAFAFVIAAAASWVLAQAFPLFRMPIITGYIIIGICCGPSGTNLISPFFVDLLSSKINAFALAFIAFAAGEEIFLPSLQNLMGPICRQLLSVSVTTFLAVTICFQVILCRGQVLFGYGASDGHDDDPTMWASSFSGRLAISMLMGSIMAARSPASAVAIVKEIGARGKGTKLMLGVTVLSDVVVLLLFSLVYAVATVLCKTDGANGQGTSFDPLSLVILFGQLLGTVLMGYLVGRMLDFVLYVPLKKIRIPYNPLLCFRAFAATGDDEKHAPKDDLHDRSKDAGENGRSFTLYRSYVKGPIILFIGWGTFIVTDWLADRSGSWFGGRTFRIESLLVCMIAACYVSHYSGPEKRHFFARILNKTAPYVFLPFFTLAGASLDIPSVLAGWAVALIVCIVRIGSIAASSLVAGDIERRHELSCTKNISTADTLEDPLVGLSDDDAGASKTTEQRVLKRSRSKSEDMENWAIRRYLWFTLLAQAGVSIGLALQVKSAFSWGERFSNVVLSVIVMNQMIGPIMCKIGLQSIMKASVSASMCEAPGDEGRSLDASPFSEASLEDIIPRDSPSLRRIWSSPPETRFPVQLRRGLSPPLRRLPSCSAYHSLMTPSSSPKKKQNNECVTPGF